ncbi:hypothetical protein CLAFUW4_14164 [Fulvia fulva]|uniref:uncharacterized protein n=1 Tax=Passalora fulva TaxID=5499 RepID=UPI0028525FB2|nr:uncharacterized protein CLAFUR5_20374 [Fulvia fulva]KAK4610609.1 hypothetical protein CLAFUR4_14167 [Fulvia fulva]KAK4611310.1 hypothetical protein CLAFUR0_14171 [Fulvia fulva]WMI39089.1 hypothetical protein CLAFUR5_20374 [Fulvia fulva]WPV22288.1 hypothetical protein CLAFUW4_14164 [Fulvia fulva]WPV37165.1 hypothetical protein CLAFUW7_14175 [Fulvia fulva]
MSSPPHLTGFTTQEAIKDALHRATIGMDNNVVELTKSAFIHPVDEPVFFMGEQSFNVDQILAAVGSMTTAHYNTGIRIDVKDGATTAVLTANAMNQHFRAGEGNAPGMPDYNPTSNPNKNLMAGGQYVVDMEKDVKDGD